MSLPQQSLQSFLNNVASGEPTPGGGTVAALSGTLAASLVAMVCRLTIGKKGYEAVAAEMEAILPRALKLQAELGDLMHADSDAYGQVMDAYKLPKATDTEKSVRVAAIQTALKYASEIPMRVAEKCAAVLELAHSVAAKGNKNAASDAGVGALMAEAGLRGAAFNVTINLSAIHDETFTRDYRARVDALVAHADAQKREILALVQARI